MELMMNISTEVLVDERDELLMSEEFICPADSSVLNYERNYKYENFDPEWIKFRTNYTVKYGFTFICSEWIEPLVNLLRGHKVLEVMAGTGALSKALKKHGVFVIPTDDTSWAKTGRFTSWEKTWCDVEEIDAVAAVKKYDDVDYILMSWPPYDEPIATQVLKAMRKHNPGAVLIYIGEGWGGCTANDKFHGLIEEIDPTPLMLEVICGYKSFDGIHDNIVFCR